MKNWFHFLLLIVVSCSAAEGLMTKRELKALNYQEINVGKLNKKPAPDEVDKYPMYPGGLEGLYKDISSELKYPKTERQLGIEGRVLVSFEISSKGEVMNVHLEESITRNIDAEAIRAINNLKKWHPAIKKRQPVNIRMRIPIDFKLT